MRIYPAVHCRGEAMKQIGTRPIEMDEFLSFRERGYHVARGLLGNEETRQIREAFMELNRNGPVEGLSDGRSLSGSISLDDPLARYPRVVKPHRRPDLAVGQLSRRYFLEPRIYPYVKAFLDAEPVGVHTMFYFKPPKSKGLELHQDNLFLRAKPGTCMVAWFAIDDADCENGGMVLVPGTQNCDVVHPGEADPGSGFSRAPVPAPAGTEPVDVELKAGDVLFFNGSLIHGSTPNVSENRFRRSFICHYIPLGSAVTPKYADGPMMFDGQSVHVELSEEVGPCSGNPASASS